MVLSAADGPQSPLSECLVLFLMPTFTTEASFLEAFARVAKLVAEIRDRDGDVAFSIGASEENRSLASPLASTIRASCVVRSNKEQHASDFFPFVDRIATENASSYRYLIVVNIENFDLGSDYIRVSSSYLETFRGSALMTGCRVEKDIFVPKIGGVTRMNSSGFSDSRRFVLHLGGLFVFSLKELPVSRDDFVLLEIPSPF